MSADIGGILDRLWMVVRSALLASALIPALSAQASAAQGVGRFQGRLVHETTGIPVAGASVSIVGATGSVRTDADGGFTWVPAPRAPFQIIVVLPGGQVARPVTVDAVQEGVTTMRIGAVSDEAVTVLGAAPSISAPAGSALTVLSGTQIARRNPENLMQALETVPGITQVSEGHASVPAIRGLARGRTLFLIDGGRVTSERRVGPSGTFLDPSVIEGIDIARGPGSVAYGSDALGGVVSVRTRRAEPGSPLEARVSGTLGAGIPEVRGAFEVSKGLERGGVLVQAHVRNAEDYDGPDEEVFNSGWEDQGFLINFTHAVANGFFTAGWQSDFGRDFERPRSNSRTVRFFHPFENSHRFTTSYQLPDVAGFRQVTATGFLGTYEQRIDQDRFATATAGRGIERADVSANDFHVKGHGERLLGPARLEFGVDVNGRYGLEALDTIQAFDLAGNLTSDTTNVSVDSARRIDTGMYLQAESALGRLARVAGGIRGDRVTTRNAGGFFGDRSTSNAAASGFGSITLVPVQRLSVTAQLSRGFRDPVLSDRYFRGPSGRGFITGNPDLEPETSLQFDLATRYTFAQTQLAAYFYYYRIDDLIERYQAEADFFFVRNRGRARLRGVEIEGRTDLGGGYSLEVAAQLAHGSAPDDEAFLDDVSPATFSAVGRKDFAGRAYAQARVAFHAEDDRPGPSEIAAPGATLIDAGGGWRLIPQLEIRAVLRNLLDDEYYASPDPRFVLAPGRSFSVTAVVEF
ncbi:MAG TPA: TonB-dependent receptor [Vicinamibacterales bacterium]|nr:TonB-dependent receptor [Vicinamibacterales bacterium]